MKKIYTIFLNLLLAIIPIALGGFIATWLVTQYSRPEIKYFSDGYYLKVNSFSVGDIYLKNIGNKPDTHITIIINETISPENIKINYLTSNGEIKNIDNKTQILINALKPNEEADIVFKVNTIADQFTIDSFTSDSGNIIEKNQIFESWWHFSIEQFGVLLVVLCAGFLIGLGIGLKKEDLIPGDSTK